MAEKSGELDETKQAENDFEFEDQINDSAGNESETKEPAAEISDDPEELRGQIEETRRGMSETLGAIQEKLSISNISEQVKEQVTEQITDAVETIKTTVSDATVGKAGKFMKNIGSEIKKLDIGKLAGDNPLPLVLIGLGIGLLAFNKYKGNSSSDYAKYRYRNRRNIYGGEPRRTNEQKSDEQKSDGISSKISNSANSAYSSASGAANKVYESASGAAGDAYDKIGDFGGQFKKQYDHHLEENPLVIGAVALAVGAAVGLAIPSTRYEGELMGEARENLVKQAQTAARGAFDKVQEVVGQAKETIVENAKDVVSQAQESLTENLEAENSGQPAKA